MMSGLTILTCLAFVLLITTTTWPPVALAASGQHRRRSNLWRGDSIIVGGDDALVSPNGDFSCGFHRVATKAYVLAIWFTASADPHTLAWAASRDTPVNGMGSRAELLGDGSLVLPDFDGRTVWSTSTSGTGADRAQLLDTGNLVVSDTILPGQLITRCGRASTGPRTPSSRGSSSRGVAGSCPPGPGAPPPPTTTSSTSTASTSSPSCTTAQRPTVG
ncbi:hypothetical protein QYE76_035208 [Lolium multiflorum]|uniref:non-specific serine/threonine protein kinase n=1 Tax=Lolium multiflorum TaxID=4521 RepID=A0AAD8QYK8_LOLMU|nr:hypothetical protein QYE76_035208 [Lolium multiflorum]